MSKFLQTIILLVSLPVALLADPAQSQMTSFSYDFYGNDRPTTLRLQGEAHFPSNSTYLRLTATNGAGFPLRYGMGRAVHSTPVLFWDRESQADFETTIKFIISPVDSSPADGLTFFIEPYGYDLPVGSSDGYFAVFNSQEKPGVFAVEFDTMPNAWDPDYGHVGIDIRSVVSRNVTRVDDAIVGKEVTARISYVGATKLISIRVDAGGEKVFEVSYVEDLSKVFPEWVQGGVSASTGMNMANHDLISWYFPSTLVVNGIPQIA